MQDFGVDGNGDGKIDPFNTEDNAATAANLITKTYMGTKGSHCDKSAAVFARYNNGWNKYVNIGLTKEGCPAKKKHQYAAPTPSSFEAQAKAELKKMGVEG